jgi:8-oxo-dGTP pyrophosphatase MutT (NUDIX family)
MDALAIPPFSAADFRARVLRLGSAGQDDDFYGDHLLNPGTRDAIVRTGVREAAVLVPVIDHRDGASVLLTKRTEKLRSHSGQVAFPGGRVDPEDGSVEAAALREADEEIGLKADHVEVIGRLPDYFTGSGYRIAPVLSIVRPGFTLTINPDEVDDAFEVPLGFLMDAANHQRGSRVWQDIERHFYIMPYGEKNIWGVTAGIIRAIHDRLYA